MTTNSRAIRRSIEQVLRKYNACDEVIIADLYALFSRLLKESLETGENTFNHPAIRAVKSVCRESVPPGLIPALIKSIGEAPDINKLTLCYVEWHARGKASGGWGWALEWYAGGIPDRFKKADPNERRLPFEV